jgi:hypothetical protein
MKEVKLKFNNSEFVIGDSVTTIGRTPDNLVSFPRDSNVSRYHAEIEVRGGELCLIDLGSSNGTTVNGQKVTGDVYLKNGDEIVLGGSSCIKVTYSNGQAETPEPEPLEAVGASAGGVQPPKGVPPAPHMPAITPPAAPDPSGGSTKLLIVAAAICCIAILFVGIAVAVYLLSGSKCEATAVITKPEAGDTISAATEIEVDARDSECVAKAVFTIDGVEFASATEPPYTVSIDPKDHPELSDGVDHRLGIVLIDEDGNQMPQSQPVLLAFETREIEKQPEDTNVAQTDGPSDGPQPQKSKEVSLIEIQEMSKRLVKQFSGSKPINVSNKQFLQEIQKKTAEYAKDGYSDRAAKYRDAINVEFVRERNLDAPLGFILAMSRSQFDPAKKGAEEGLWKMSTEFVAANGYNGTCGTEPISDPSQNCAAKASSAYMKALVTGFFSEYPLLSVAAFGKSTQDAGVWFASLPPNKTDIGAVVRTQAEREQLVRFFAAGIVAENPQKFGLKKDRPLSELYKLTM